MIELAPELRRALPESTPFDAIMALGGTVYRSHKHRTTMRCRIGEHDYFVKLHSHTGWPTILKDVLRLRRPTLTARPEQRAITYCEQRGIPTVTSLGWGVRGWNPARLESFIITRPLEGFVHLDEIMTEVAELPRRSRHRWMCALAAQLGRLARAFHQSGMNHRDFYLCHFMAPKPDLASAPPPDIGLRVIDLHRVQIRTRVPAKWLAKDLAGLFFSLFDAQPTSAEVLRFLRAYFDTRDLRSYLKHQKYLLRAVRRRAISVYRSDHGKSPELPAFLASF